MSAVILAVIVVMWAVVLVPMWLRRHDAATESRSVDKFSAAMRVLSRRQPSSGSARYVLMPRRESAAAPSVHVSGAAAPRPSRPAPSRPAAPRRKASLAVRRRRVLLGLLGVAFLTMVLAAAGVVGWVLQIVIDLIAVAFVVHLRTQARRSVALARARRRPAASVAAAPASAAAPSAPATPTAASYAARLARAVAPSAAPVSAAAEPEVAATPDVAAGVVAAPVVAAKAAEDVAEATGTDDAAAWEPVPVPPPTYTMKPPAPPRYYPPVQPDSDAGLVDGGVGDEAVAARVEPEAGVGDDGQLDEILTHRWAVND